MTQNIKYDGSDAEMLRLNLIDEFGNVINARRNDFNHYMATVWAKNHPNEKSPYVAKLLSIEQEIRYFEEIERKQNEFKSRLCMTLKRILGHNK